MHDDETINRMIQAGRIAETAAPGRWIIRGVPCGRECLYAVEYDDGTYTLTLEDRYNGPQEILAGEADDIEAWVDEHTED